MAAVTDAQLEAAAHDLAAAFGLDLVLLFGSAAVGDRALAEDLDIAVLAPLPIDALAVTDRLMSALRVDAIDVTDLRRADSLVLAVAARDGTVLYQSAPHVFASFRSLAYRRFADDGRYRDQTREYIRRFVREQGPKWATPVERAIVERKLARIVENISRLRSFETLTVDAYVADWTRQKAIERVLQETIESAIDINHHLLAGLSSERAPFAHHDSFLALGRAGAIPPELATALAPAAGLRNRLVHEYDEIDDNLVLAGMRSAIDLVQRYVAAIEGFLD
ncbi:MAG: type VII toxin-antitoxin system HepT family RNase toxin, partial [Gemmatimonadaceae bacterium]